MFRVSAGCCPLATQTNEQMAARTSRVGRSFIGQISNSCRSPRTIPEFFNAKALRAQRRKVEIQLFALCDFALLCVFALNRKSKVLPSPNHLFAFARFPFAFLGAVESAWGVLGVGMGAFVTFRQASSLLCSSRVLSGIVVARLFFSPTSPARLYSSSRPSSRNSISFQSPA